MNESIEARLSHVEAMLSTLKDTYAPIIKVMEMLQPIQTSISKMENTVYNLSERITTVFDMYEQSLRDKATADIKLADEKLELAKSSTLENKIKVWSRTIALILSLLTLFSILIAILKYYILMPIK
jgi:hypothetical protein